MTTLFRRAVPLTLASLSTLAAGLSACADIGPDEPIAEAAAAVCTPPASVDPARSLFVTDLPTMSKFGFQRVMDALITTAGVAPQTSLQLYQQWWDLNNDAAHGASASNPHCDDNGGTVNGFPVECPRQEGALAFTNPFTAGKDHYTPVGVVNRFDLAPADGAHCGQYRVVFGKDSGKTNGADRNFIIFEAVLPNPDPAAGLAACLPVAQFWADLSSDGSATSRAAKIESFFFTGLPGFEPVIHANHYGLVAPTGQIRTNQFMASTGGQQWELREYRLREPCTDGTCTLKMKMATVKTNPFGTLFAGTDADSLAFQAAFLKQVPKLAAATEPNGVAMTIANAFNAGESREQDTSSQYEFQASASYANQIQSKLVSIGSTLSSTELLRRASTQACAGCHKTESNASMGGFNWPPSLGFTHVDENRNLSAALTGTFLPHRADVLITFITNQCSGTAVSGSPDVTIGGGPVDASN
ncbi:MAG: hypothetical protein QM820_17275 [Minicystis sp.]